MFQWSDAYLVNIPIIDQQHKKLFEIGNDIHKLIIESEKLETYDEIEQEIEKLIDYTQFHFKHEERLLKEYNYVNYEGHVKEHEKFMDFLNAINIETIQHHQQEYVDVLLKFVAQWIFKHMMHADFNYSDLLITGMEFDK